jgi:CRP/FNR family transcriptional regulator, cyclic AMP receptor protein
VNHEDLLASTPLFSSLNADEKRELLRLADSFSFPAGTVIFEQGDTADGMYVLERGKVQLWTRFLGEEQLALAQVSAGDVLGEFGLIDRGARSATAEVVDSAQGHFFSLRRFELLYADRRPAARKTMRELRLSLCQRLRSASTELGESPPAFYEYTQRRMRPSPPTAPVRSPASALDLSRLRVLPFFGQFSIPALQSLLAPLSVWTLPRGHVLFSDGDPRGSAFATVRGAVEVVAGRGNEWRRQAILGPGRLFGLVAPLDGGPRETGAVVRESAVVLEIPESELQAHVQKEGPTSETLVDTMHAALSVALRATNRTLLAQSAMGRIARREKRSRVTGSP